MSDHKYDKVSIRDINDTGEILAEMDRVKGDIDSYPWRHPHSKTEEELESYYNYLMKKCAYLVFGDSMLFVVENDKQYSPESYEYLEIEHGITDPKVVPNSKC